MTHKALADVVVDIVTRVLAEGGTKRDIDAALKPLLETYPADILQATLHQVYADGYASR